MDQRIPNEQGNYGRYDDESEALCRKLQADAVVLIVLKPGVPGFSISSPDVRVVKQIPGILRQVADNMDEQLKATEGN